MIIEGILATSHLLSDGHILSKQALDGMASEINEAEWSIPSNLEHDHTLPPIGKLISAEVKSLQDGEFALVATSEIFEQPVEISLNDGSTAFVWKSQADSRPFKSAETECSDSILVSYSHKGFSDPGDEDEFRALVRRKPSFESEYQPIIQRSVDAGTLLLVLLPFVGLLGTMTAYKFADRMSDRFADELIGLYDVIRKAVIGLAKDKLNHFKLVTVVVTSRGIPEVEFVAKVADADPVISALTLSELENSIDRAVDLYHSVDARKVQYILGESNKWDFNFLLTGTGQVVGSPASYTRQVEKLNALDRTQSNSRQIAC